MKDMGNDMTDNPRNFGEGTPKYFDEITKTIFAPLYPVIARQIVEGCKITEGICIDLGSGPAPLAIALAKITDLKIYALDISEEMYKLAKENIKAEGLSKRITPIVGDVQALPFDDNFADLLVSRGSLFFWEDKVKAFKEIYRTLKPSGMTYIGGGFGTAELEDKITKEMEERDSDWKRDVKERLGKRSVERFRGALREIKIQNYEIIHDDSGLWVLIRKGMVEK
jgi:ubiquinone/menaquinone biosynthesis C-methylase UbiE